MADEIKFTIGELARQADVNVETIRYYEGIGLVRQPPKPPRGWRRYGPDVGLRLRFIKRAQQLGFSLEEIKTLLRLRTSHSLSTCSTVARRAKKKLDEIDAKIDALQSMRAALVALADACPGVGTGDNCPMLSSLEN
ncbi:MAG: MerR family transcriptional regulator [Nannocystaceae bacterium]